MSFSDLINNFKNDLFLEQINNKDKSKISQLLSEDKISIEHFPLLLSDAASDMLPEIAGLAQELTIKRFGKIINFYTPIYLSNECNNHCVYCGFNKAQNIIRKTLNFNAIENEYLKLKKLGFDNVLLLTGDAPNKADVNFIAESVRMAKKHFTFVGLEIYAMDTEDYAKLVQAGADGLTIYQETYDKDIYEKMHLKGHKKNYLWRLDAPDRAAKAGFRKIGLGSLLGLGDWKYEAAMLAFHLDYLQKKYWKVEYTLGFPRIRPLGSSFDIPCQVSDKNLVQMLSALRIFLQEVGFILTTRESPELRDKLIELCITQISAGSKTNPGGYSDDYAGEQFSVSDSRSLEDMIKVVNKKGYEAVIKDWDNSFCGVTK